jgi:hypothetical protein
MYLRCARSDCASRRRERVGGAAGARARLSRRTALRRVRSRTGAWCGRGVRRGRRRASSVQVIAKRGTGIRDDEEIATFATFPDGTPRVQAATGDLRIWFTDLDTGESVERELDGVGVISCGADGSNTWYFFGPAAVGFRPTDDYPAGF